jgi:sugar (pentulose or hexulose) kinase
VSDGRPLLIGIDVGTTRTKAGVVDLAGEELGSGAMPTVWTRTASGAEARPDDFVGAVNGALAALLEHVPPGEIVGVGITGMAETVVLVGPDGDALGPSIAWHDRRAEEDFGAMEATLTRDLVARTTGLTRDPIPTVATLRWLLRTDPQLRRATSVLSIAEWIAFALTGTRASELSLASRTGALAITSGRWWPEVIEWAGLEPSLFGELRAAGSPWGRIERPAAGLERLRGAVVTVAGHDHLAAAIGSGVTTTDQIMDSCGTAEALVLAVPADPDRDPAAGHALGFATGWHALPGCHCLLAGLPLGIELGPLLERLGATHRAGQTSLDAGALAALEAGPDAQPADPAAGEWLAGVRAAVLRSATRCREVERLAGPIAEVRISGGWALNPVVRRLKEAEFPRTVYPLVTEAGVRGAALMGGIAAGAFEAVERFPAPATRSAAGPADDDPQQPPLREKVS